MVHEPGAGPATVGAVAHAENPLRDEPVTHRSALRLAEDIRTGRVTAREVVTAHLAVLERVRGLNAVAVDRAEAALAEADAVDARVRGGDPAVSAAGAPLLGVPISVKELIAVEGMPHTGGFAHRRRFREAADAPAVARLRAAGAIVIGLGNSAGPIYWIETNNWLYGRTRNAYDPRRTAGGSSGGDGAIVGSGGAPVALGSDMAGSVRIPAHLNGVFGHMPSPGLVPITGHFPIPLGTFRRTLYLGPLARRAEDLAPVLRILAGPDGEDPYVTPMPLGDPASVALAGLPVRVAVESSTVPTRPRASRAVADAAAALATRGAEVSSLPLRQLRWAFVQFAAVAVAELDLLASWSAITEAPAGRQGRPPLIVTAPARVLRLAEAAPVRTTRTLAARRLLDAARRAGDDVAGALGGGVLLYPPFPRVAPRHRTTTLQPWLATNTVVFNLLGLPATQVPLGLADDGLPRGVQVVAAPGGDHVTMAVAGALEQAYGGWVDPADRHPARTTEVSGG